LLLQSSQRIAARAGSSSSHHLLRWLVGLGGIGVFGVAIVDSSMIPLPIPGSTDLLLLLLAVHPATSAPHVSSFVVCAIAGSIIGGYLTWGTGRKGGLATLEKRVPARLLARVTGWLERHGTLAIGLAAVLPPPIPLMLFLLAAGALGISRRNFLFSYGAARIARYSLIGWLGFTYGRQVVHIWRRSLTDWSTPILCIYGGLAALAAAYGFWRFLRERRVAA
jgi:membrane protein YqaA with SNARE-associated domain